MITYTILRNGKVISTRTAFTRKEIRQTIEALSAADLSSFFRFEITEPASA